MLTGLHGAILSCCRPLTDSYVVLTSDGLLGSVLRGPQRSALWLLLRPFSVSCVGNSSPIVTASTASVLMTTKRVFSAPNADFLCLLLTIGQFTAPGKKRWKETQQPSNQVPSPTLRAFTPLPAVPSRGGPCRCARPAQPSCILSLPFIGALA